SLSLYALFCSLSNSLFFFNVTPTTEIYTLSLHDALPISLRDELQVLDEAVAADGNHHACAGLELRDQGRRNMRRGRRHHDAVERDRKSTRLNSSHVAISYAVFCLKKKKKNDAHGRIHCHH